MSSWAPRSSLLIAALVVGAAALGAKLRLDARKAEPVAAVVQEPAREPLPIVRVVTPQASDSSITIALAGTVQAWFQASAQEDKLRLFVSAPESFVRFLRPGLKGDVTVPEAPDRHYAADFLTVAKSFDAETRTVTTEFAIDNADHSLSAGSSALLTLKAHNERERWRLPLTSVVFQEYGTQVATVGSDDMVHFKSIEVSKFREAVVDIASGVTPRDRVIDHPSAGLLEGDRVQVAATQPGTSLAAHRLQGEPD